MEQCVIEKWTEKGHGRAFQQGKAIDIKGAFVGETVRVDLKKGKRGGKKGILKSIEIPSVERVLEKCSHTLICGGCNLHGLSYDSQVQIKQKNVQKLFSQPVQPILIAQEPFYYRNKMEFSFSQDKDKKKYLGLVEEESRGKVFEQKDCALCPEWMITTLKSVFDHWCGTSLDAYYLHTNTGSLRTLTCRVGVNTADRMVILGLSGNPMFALSFEELEGFKEAILNANKECKNLSVFVVLTHVEKGVPTYTSEMHLFGKDHISEVLCGKTFFISPQSFFQPNPKQAELLYKTAFDLLQPKPSDSVLDLYCGVGSIGICLKERVHKVVGIELNRYAVCDAKRNISINNLENVEVTVGDVKDSLAQHKDTPFDIIILDPPRAGLDEQVIRTLQQMRVEKILYISCNPKSLSRDLASLENCGYAVEILQPVDQFPQTLHLEMIALFKLKNN
jgi:23S rRNA (uracil1939-C5)-methyltransferase